MGSALASPLVLASVTISMTWSRARRIRWKTASLLIRADSQSGCLRHVWGKHRERTKLNVNNLMNHFHSTFTNTEIAVNILWILSKPSSFKFCTDLGSSEKHHGTLFQHSTGCSHSCLFFLILQVLRDREENWVRLHSSRSYKSFLKAQWNTG